MKLVMITLFALLATPVLAAPKAPSKGELAQCKKYLKQAHTTCKHDVGCKINMMTSAGLDVAYDSSSINCRGDKNPVVPQANPKRVSQNRPSVNSRQNIDFGK